MELFLHLINMKSNRIHTLIDGCLDYWNHKTTYFVVIGMILEWEK